MLQKLNRHLSITTTIGYQADFINKDTDDALDGLVNFKFPDKKVLSKFLLF